MMADVTPTSYEALVMRNAMTMVQNSAALRTWLGITTPAEMLASIIESWGGDARRGRDDQPRQTFADGTTKLIPSKYIIVDIPEDGIRIEEGGDASDDYSGLVNVFIFQERQLAGETAYSAIRRARNLQGTARSEIRAQFGASGRLAKGIVQPLAIEIPDITSAEKDHLISPLVIDWYA